MGVAAFLTRWREAGPAERANKDSFLSELCDVLGVERPLPKTNDPEKDRYVFEKDVARSREDRTSIGRIDLFRAGCFVLEAKQVDSAKRGTPAWEAVKALTRGSECSRRFWRRLLLRTVPPRYAPGRPRAAFKQAFE